MRMNTRLDINR